MVSAGRGHDIQTEPHDLPVTGTDGQRFRRDERRRDYVRIATWTKDLIRPASMGIAATVGAVTVGTTLPAEAAPNDVVTVGAGNRTASVDGLASASGSRFPSSATTCPIHRRPAWASGPTHMMVLRRTRDAQIPASGEPGGSSGCPCAVVNYSGGSGTINNGIIETTPLAVHLFTNRNCAGWLADRAGAHHLPRRYIHR